MSDPVLHTPDGRYIVVRDRLWRATNPGLSVDEKTRHVAALMRARRAVGDARRRDDPIALRLARDQVDEAKHQLGERGPVWWDDGAPDLNRHMVHTTPYATWHASITADDES
ncbi:MAG: hypothetical protein EOP73_03210 [Variovorax sp.]|jgi:hypothetical protein|nr:MAG: hypothetical protein EOP73_03210 [Variovorax sp.]